MANISMVQTKWGVVIATVREQQVPNDRCEIAPGRCSIVAYLAMTGQTEPFASIHNHNEGEFTVINVSVRNPDTGAHLLTGPFVNLVEAIHDAARIFAVEHERQVDAERAKRGLPPKAQTIAEFKQGVTDATQLDALRKKDTKDVAEYGPLHWEAQLSEILGRKK